MHARTIQWARLFELPERPGLPLQGRLRLAIVQAVLDGRLASGAPLRGRDSRKSSSISCR